MTIWQGFLTVKDGLRQEYFDEIRKNDLIRIFRSHPGNVFYSIAFSAEDENVLVVCDGWDTKEHFLQHDASADVDIWREIYAKYVVSFSATLYEAQTVEM